MELRHLRYFVAVAEHLNFTKAAAQLRVAQPALSRQIRDLEGELGVPLLERNSRSVRLTDAGAAFQGEARAVLQRAEQAIQGARAFASGDRGEIHLGYAPSPTVELLPQALHAFQAEAPAVRVTPHDLSTEEMLRGLRDGVLDAALMVPSSANAMRGLAFEKLRQYPVCAAVNRAHRLARIKDLGLSHLLKERLIVYTRKDYPEYHEFLAEIFKPFGGIPEIAEEHESSTSLIAAAEAGSGVAIVPSCLACLAGPRLKLRELQPSPPPIVVGLAYPRRDLSPAARRFVKTVAALEG
jgi:DNA-binding transcriptional LysR family regulator